jgi:hypothetical protein
VSHKIPIIIDAYNEKVDMGLTLGQPTKNLGDNYPLVVNSNSNDRKVEIAKHFDATILLQDGIGKKETISQAIQSLNYVLLNSLSMKNKLFLKNRLPASDQRVLIGG